MTTQANNWYRLEIPKKEKDLKRAESELNLAKLALAKCQAQFDFAEGQLDYYCKMADLTDEEGAARDAQMQAWTKEARPLLKAVA